MIEQGQKEQPLSVSPVLLVQTQFTDFYPDGQARKQDTYQYNPKKSGQKTLHDDMNLSYVGFDSWHLVQNAGRRYRYDSKKWTDRNAVTVTFDANGYPQSIDGDLQGQEGFRWFQVNPEGRIVLKENDKGQELYIYGPQGQVIGWVGDLQTDPTSIDVPSKVNFDPIFHVVTRNWPPAMPGQYVAQAGDTFNSISRLLYGDPSFAYLIAQANGYSPGDNAPVGAVLKVPQVTLTGEHNRAGQFAPYNPGALIGSLYPDMPIPPPPPRHFLAMILETIASVVITILLSPTGGGVVGAMWLVTILEDAAIYAGISGLSDVATQMIGMAFGSQEKFSWHEFGNALETGAMSGALGGALAQLGRLNGLSFIGKGFKQAKGADVNWTEIGAKLFDNEVLTISGELASMALGQQKRFSWLDVFNSALQTGAGEVLAKEDVGVGDDDKRFKGFKGFVSDVASSEIDAAISAEVYHDRFDPVLAFAHAVGTYAGEHLKHAWHGHLHNKGQGQNTHKVSHQVRQQGMGAGAVQLPPPADTTSPYLPKHTTGPQGGHQPDPLDTPIVNDDGTLAWSIKVRGNNNISLWHRGSTGHKEGVIESQQLKCWVYQGAQAEAHTQAAVKQCISQYLVEHNSAQGAQAAWFLSLGQRLDANTVALFDPEHGILDDGDESISLRLGQSLVSHDRTGLAPTPTIGANHYFPSFDRWLYRNQNTWYGKAIYDVVEGSSDFWNEHQEGLYDFDQDFREFADFVSYFDPFAIILKAGYESDTGVNPITQQPVTRRQVYVDEAIAALPVVGDIASGLIKGGARAVRFFKVVKGAETEEGNLARNLAHNRVQHEALKAELRQNMQKPIARDDKLRAIINKLYRPNAKVGSGSTADAVRQELKTGKLVGGKLHLQKAQDALRSLNKWLKNNPKATPGDKAAAENVLHDLRDALEHIPRPKPNFYSH